MNSDDYARYALFRVLGFLSDPYALVGTYGVIQLLKNPYTRTYMAKTLWDVGKTSGGLAWRQSQRTARHLIKPAAKAAGKKVAAKYAAQRAASIVGPRAFGIGVGGAALSLAAMGVAIAEGRGQSGIQMAEGQKEYEEHAIRTGGGRGVVI
jgi:hypothetical protein